MNRVVLSFFAACLMFGLLSGPFQVLGGLKRAADIQPAKNGLRGEIKSINFESKNLGKARNVKVYLPPGHDSKKSYPVVYAADGFFNFKAELVEPLIESGRVLPFIVVGVTSSPEPLREHEYIVYSKPERFVAHEKFFCEEIIPWAEKEWGASGDRKDRVVYGSSYSGAFVLTLSNRRPDTFGHVYAMMVSGLRTDDFAKELKVHAKEPTRYTMMVGSKDRYCLEQVRKVEKILKERNLPVSTTIIEGGTHSTALNQKHFPVMIEATFGKKK
jgi:enterochelin esterase-like enzyme